MNKHLLTIAAFHLFPLTIFTLHLPTNIILYLDKTNPNYLDKLQSLSTFTVPIQANITTLTYVIGIFRHGNKSPTETFIGDKYPYYDKTFWPNGYSRLTEIGKEQLYSMGRKLRMRYNDYLSEKYKPEEILVQANPVDRVYMSAACLLAGLYPPVIEPSRTKPLRWQPVPIWNQKHDMSEVAKNPATCPRFYKLEQEIINKLSKYSYQYQDLIDYMESHSGIKINNLREIYRYWNIFYFQQQEGYKLPSWIDDRLMETLTKLSASSFTSLLSSNREMLRLMTGPVIKEFAYEIQRKMIGKSPNKKMHLEGGHGTTINAILPVLGFKKPFIAELGSVYLLEVHSTPNGNYVQVIRVSNSSTDTVDLLEIPGCGFECPLNKIYERMDKVIPSDWNEECQVSAAGNGPFQTVIMTTITFCLHFTFII